MIRLNFKPHQTKVGRQPLLQTRGWLYYFPLAIIPLGKKSRTSRIGCFALI